MTSKIKNTEKIYKFEDLEKLVDNISKIKNRSHLETIRDIIVQCNPSVQITENNNGLFLRFESLKTETYTKIISFLKKLSAEKLRRNSELLSDSIDINDDFEKEKSVQKQYLTSSEKELIFAKQSL